MINSSIDKKVLDKARNIKALLFDVDGVLTDGSLTYSGNTEEYKTFNVKDGQIIKHLKENGIVVGAITGRSSVAVNRRCEELKLDFFEQGVSDKYALIDQKLKTFNLKWDDVCYIGDDIIDLKALKAAQLSACPMDALEYIKTEVDYICMKDGGKGVVRELADIILQAQNKLEKVINSYL